MTLAHLSIDAQNPQHIAGILAQIMAGTAMPFPPCPGAFVAFDHADDGIGIEVYPLGTQVQRGPDQIAFVQGPKDTASQASHVCLTSPLTQQELLDIGTQNGWTARVCNRGPFKCVEIWLEDRVLVEALDPDMAEDYHRNMTAAQWRAMFGLPPGKGD
ncbi:hypothetical protein [uncultured Tateyamaria sp.]|uniref:hypothetical protein n=1 Tax=uncultured Tateyamaria sp. TaxID=455651 RepID=UPI002630B4E0|nr:hypothetical protein [uncultured Tateyamaria sp.]